MEILFEEVIRQHGAYRCVRQYIAGHHPHLGRLHNGWRGPETVVEKCFVLPHRAVRVVERDERAVLEMAAG